MTLNVLPLIEMPIIKLETQINAPIDRVFDLARSIDAHMASTKGSKEKAVLGRTSGLIQDGETVTWEAKHLGIRQRLTVRISKFNRPHLFKDEMVSGAFASMNHTHIFTETNGGTLMKDEFNFSTPLGILGRVAEALFLTNYMTKFLVLRANELKNIAESNDWKIYLPTL